MKKEKPKLKRTIRLDRNMWAMDWGRTGKVAPTVRTVDGITGEPHLLSDRNMWLRLC